MTDYLSKKLRIISLIAMLMVVFLHSTNMNVKFNSGELALNGGLNMFIQNFISQGLTRIAVPIFFAISGYLFFLNFHGSLAEYSVKIKKRFKTLLIPYLTWSIWGVLFYFILQQIPQSKQFFTKELISDYDYGDFFNTILINPIPYQLWFLRDLMLLVICSPIIYWLIKYSKGFALVILFILWLGIFEINLYIFSNESVLFFSVGCFLAHFKTDFVLKKHQQKSILVVLLFWFLLLTLKTLLIQYQVDKNILIILLHKASILMGFISVWYLYDFIYQKDNESSRILLNLSFYSFFLFAFHEPILTIVKKGMAYILGVNNTSVLLGYFISPILVICISLIIGKLLKKLIPTFYGILTGAR